MNQLRTRNIAGLLAGLLISSATFASATILVSYADTPGELKSTLSGTNVYTFDGLTADTKATNINWAGVGTIDQGYIQSANQYGGATDDGQLSGTPTVYIVQSLGVGGADHTEFTNLTFNSQQAYFGFWWSAGDAANRLTFTNNGVLVAQYNTSTLLEQVASDPGYRGNPINAFLNNNSGEAYAFINIYGLEGTTWDNIQFDNLGGSGFETDNWTTRELAYGSLPGEDPTLLPGKPAALVTGNSTVTIPEPSAAVLGAFGLLALLRRNRR